MDALVTDVHTRAAVSGLRGLGRGGVKVLAVAPRATAPGMWSRFASERAVAAHAVRDPAAFAARVDGLAVERGPLVVYPVQEEAIDALYGASPGLSPEAILPYPGVGPLRLLRDKRELPRLAAEHGFATPDTLAEGRAGDLACADLPTPCVVKPVGKGGAIPTAVPIDSREELRRLLGQLPAGEPLVVQKRLRGPLVSLGLVIGRDGRLVSRFQHLASRTWPAAAGSSALAISVAPDEALAARARTLLDEAGYWGLAELEFIATRRGPALIDVNPRFYGCMPLPIACGLNLPAIWHAVVVGGALPSPAPYRVGVTYRWLKADVTAAVHGRPRRLLQRSRGPRTGAMWAGDDLLPSALLAAPRGERILERLHPGVAGLSERGRLRPETPRPTA